MAGPWQKLNEGVHLYDAKGFLRCVNLDGRGDDSICPTGCADTGAATIGTTSGDLEKITVTGYVVPRVGVGPNPVATFDQDFIKNQGDQTISDVIQRLPQNVGSFTPAVNVGVSFSPAASEVNFRGLGTSSTLVLIDGRRQTFFPFAQNGYQSFVDLNSIPLAAVDRIETLKDGASATYGSDAIAGVVNVILKDNYNGDDLDFHYGISQRGDDETYHVQLTGGIAQKLSSTSNFNILTAFDYFESTPIAAVDRSYSSNWNHTLLPSGYFDNRSPYTETRNFVDAAGNLYSVVSGTKGPNITQNDFVINGGGNLSNRRVFDSFLMLQEQRYGGLVKMCYEPFP